MKTDRHDTCIGAANIVCDNQQLGEGADDEEKHLYKAIHSQARLLLLVQLVEKDIKPTIIKIKTCYEIWTHLRTAYCRDTAIDAIGRQCSLALAKNSIYTAYGQLHITLRNRMDVAPHCSVPVEQQRKYYLRECEDLK